MTTKRAVLLAAAMAMAMAGFGSAGWALTDTAAVTVSAVLPQRAQLDIIRDVNSVTRGSTNTVLFDRTDDDPIAVGSQPNPDPNFMYAPYRSEVGKNWHLLQIISNGSKMTVTATASGSAGGGKDLDDILDVFFGGFFETSGNSKGGKSGDWELLSTFKRELQEPFTGSAPLNYRLRLQGVPAGTSSGTVTYTLVTE